MAKQESKGTVVRRVKASSAGSSAARTDEAGVTKKVKASDTSKKTTKKPAVKAAKAIKSVKRDKKPAKKAFFLLRPIFAIGRYFRYSWHELRQVRWTNRRATWGLTIAVLLFCAFFAALIMLSDWIFNWVIQEVIL